MTYLLFIKRLDELHTLEQRKSQRLGSDLDRASALASDLDRASALASDLVHMLQNLLPRAWGIEAEAFAHFKTQPEYPLQRDYSVLGLVLGLRDTSAQHEKNQRRIIATHIDSVIGWELSDEQTRRAVNYLTATRLLQECLHLAAVSDRQAVEDTLLLPPGAWRLPQPGSAPADDPATWWQGGG
jgi:hypothetical protein